MACNDNYNNCKLYETIRKNGGWQNWNMEILNFFNCVDRCEAKNKEQEYFILLNANLNSVEQFPKQNPKQSKKNTDSQKESQIAGLDNETDKLSTQNLANLAKFYCASCKTKTNNKFDFGLHLLTAKHKKNTSRITKITNKVFNSKSYVCCCEKKYQYSSGLSKHLKRCSKNQQLQSINQTFNQPAKQAELILFLMKENKEFKELLIEQNEKLIELAKEGKTINNIHNHNGDNNNTINNKFNMSVFLNEQCSNALNIMDFIAQLKLKLSDLEAMETLGYVNGITSIFVRGLKELDVTQRPIHCSDLKREVIYIKDNGIWVKDEEDKPKMKKVIQHITGKNLRQMKEWRETYPEWIDTSSKKNEQYMMIMNKSSGGIDDAENEKFFNKIIKNVAKEVLINKSQLY